MPDLGMKMKPGSRRAIGALVVFLTVSFMPGLFGSFFRPGAWYQGLVKPALNPPNWLFGPVWTLLYILMGVSAWLVWCKGRQVSVSLALVLFAIQLLLNGLWSYLFFGLQRPGLALVNILGLWVAIAATLISFWRKSRPAGLLIVPYLLWVSFAIYLNLAIWRLNMPSQ